jgi:hypothetical protein
VLCENKKLRRHNLSLKRAVAHSRLSGGHSNSNSNFNSNSQDQSQSQSQSQGHSHDVYIQGGGVSKGITSGGPKAEWKSSMVDDEVGIMQSL